jgi:hypothetical protein
MAEGYCQGHSVKATRDGCTRCRRNRRRQNMLAGLRTRKARNFAHDRRSDQLGLLFDDRFDGFYYCNSSF